MIMDQNSLTTIWNCFEEPEISNIKPLVRIFTDQMDLQNVLYKLLNILLKKQH